MHAEVEATVRILGPRVSVDDYRAFLITLWGFHRPIEAELRGVKDLPSALPDLPRRWKSSLIAEDLRALGLTASQLGPGARAPRFPTLARALGGMYVVEGSTLGGRHIQRHLELHLPQLLPDATRFLSCYGADNGSMWNAFREQTLRAARTFDLDEDEIVAGAKQAFSCAKEWFSLRAEQTQRRLSETRP